jgi:hypothetical protein
MEKWHSKALGDRMAALAPSARIQQMFMPMFAAAGQPSNMAVFSHYDRQTNLVTAYFSPGAARLAAFFKAAPCEKPPSEGIGLLVGDAGCWEIYFPDKKRKAVAC